MVTATSLRPKEKLPVVYTSKAKCRDCYRCVRVCPVNAIKMKDGQAQVIPELCIACGTCIINCPQHAKEYRMETDKVLHMLETDGPIAITVAPTFAVYYSEWEQKRLPSALRQAGFQLVSETAVGAYQTAIASKEYIEQHPSKNHICTACPAVVNYVLHQSPHLANQLIPVASPMIIHARMIKKKFPEMKVVFAGPCVAKKDEAQWPDNTVWIDAVLTFEELDDILKEKKIDILNCEDSSFSEMVPGESRLFPLEGGLLRTAGLSTDMLDERIVTVSGYREVREALEGLSDTLQPTIIEPMFCKNGCINGPASSQHSSFQGRTAILEHTQRTKHRQLPNAEPFNRIGAKFPSVSKKGKEQFSEDQIREVLRITGKHEKDDELNCTACGYASCREKAIAVLRGMAEPEMCIPFMRKRAENQYDAMIMHDPNGILLLDKNLSILHMNNAFKKMFSCSDALLGKKISYLTDPGIFERLQSGKENVIKEISHYANYNLICHVIAFSLPEEEHYAGVFVDITDTQLSKEKLTAIKSETILKAQELIDHQISLAQELAKFLGENTARGEVLMKNLIDTIKK